MYFLSECGSSPAMHETCRVNQPLHTALLRASSSALRAPSLVQHHMSSLAVRSLHTTVALSEQNLYRMHRTGPIYKVIITLGEVKETFVFYYINSIISFFQVRRII